MSSSFWRTRSISVSKSSTSARTNSRPSEVLRMRVSSLARSSNSAKAGAMVVNSTIFKQILLATYEQTVMDFPSDRLHTDRCPLLFDVVEDTIGSHTQLPGREIIGA